MAEEKEKDDAENAEGSEEETPKKSKKGIFLGGGIVGLIAAGWALSLMGTPAMPEEKQFAGPFIVALSPEDIQVNLSGGGGKRFLVMTLQSEYDSYEELYATTRVADPLYQAKLKDALIRVSRQKTKEDLDDAVGEEIFKGEVREALDPLLFPIHVGNEIDCNGVHETSGIGPGRSIEKSTLRSGFFAHRISLDVPAKKIRLDDGPELTFEGNEIDLQLQNEHNDILYVDVSKLIPEFVGEVNAGTFGRVRNIYFGKLLVQ